MKQTLYFCGCRRHLGDDDRDRFVFRRPFLLSHETDCLVIIVLVRLEK